MINKKADFTREFLAGATQETATFETYLAWAAAKPLSEEDTMGPDFFRKLKKKAGFSTARVVSVKLEKGLIRLVPEIQALLNSVKKSDEWIVDASAKSVFCSLDLRHREDADFDAEEKRARKQYGIMLTKARKLFAEFDAEAKLSVDTTEAGYVSLIVTVGGKAA